MTLRVEIDVEIGYWLYKNPTLAANVFELSIQKFSFPPTPFPDTVSDLQLPAQQATFRVDNVTPTCRSALFPMGLTMDNDPALRSIVADHTGPEADIKELDNEKIKRFANWIEPANAGPKNFLRHCTSWQSALSKIILPDSIESVECKKFVSAEQVVETAKPMRANT